MAQLVLDLSRRGHGLRHLLVQAFLETRPQPVHGDFERAFRQADLPGQRFVATFRAGAPDHAPQGFKPGDPPGKDRTLLQKTLQLNFWRPGDEYVEDQRIIRFGIPGKVDYQWVYR